MSDWRHFGNEPSGTPGWSTRGLEAKLALAIALPLAAGALVVSFLPWPEARWWAFAGVALAVGAGTWTWIRGTLVRQLRVLERAMASGRLTDLRGLPVGGGWGELSGLAAAVAAFLSRQQDLERDAAELAALRGALATLARTAGAWADDERIPDWEAALAGLPAPPADAEPLVRALALAATRLDERLREARAVSGLITESVDEAISRTGTAAATAERQFMEATSLLTVLRELKRWTGEVAQGAETLAGAIATPPDPRAGDARRAARAALDAAGASLGNAALAVRHARELGEESDAWHDAAALAALESAATALGAAETREADLVRLTDALTALVTDTRRIRERAAVLTQRADDDLARLRTDGAAVEARLAALAALEAPTESATVTGPARAAEAWTQSRRALDRVQEMLREALARTEKLVKESERTSSESLRAGEAWSAVRDEVDGLTARLVPADDAGDAGGGAADPARAAATGDPLGGAPGGEARGADAAPVTPDEDRPQRPLRVLGPDDFLPDDETWSHG